MTIGNGVKVTYFGRLLVTGDQDIPDTLTCIDTVVFNLLTFTPTLDGLVDFDGPTGIFTFKINGMLDLSAVLNIDTTTGNTEVEVVTEFDSGSGFEKLNARTAELPVIGSKQTVVAGTIAEVELGNRLRFFVRSPDASASFQTQTLPDGSVVVAAVLHLKLWTR